MNRIERALKILQVVCKELTAERDFPSMMAQIDEWGTSSPFDGMEILDGTPVFMNTLPKYAAMIAGGAHVTAVVRENLSFDTRIPDILQSLEIPFIQTKIDKKFDFVLDCIAANADQTATYGRCELTRTGIHLYEAQELDVPVFAADSGKIKQIETVLGTGEGCLRAMRQTGLDPNGKKVLLFGHGRVGRGIEYYLTRAGAKISIVDPAQGFSFDPCMLRDAWAVVTATGIHHAHNGIADILKESNAILINMGADDEYGPNMPPERVLNNKNSFNFILKEPTQTRYIDSTLALHNAGALYLLQHPGLKGMVMPPEKFEDKILRPALNAGFINDEIRDLGL